MDCHLCEDVQNSTQKMQENRSFMLNSEPWLRGAEHVQNRTNMSPGEKKHFLQRV